MNILKKKNIFSQIPNNKTIFLSNVKNYFGSRIIDTLIHKPTSNLDKNLKEDYNLYDVGNIITLDVLVVEHQKSFNNKSPFKIVTKTKADQSLNILFFSNFKSFFAKKLLINCNYRITGKLQYFSNSFQIIHPTEIIKLNENSFFEEIEPQYNLSRKKINKKKFRELILCNLKIFQNFEFPQEWIADDFKEKDWPSFKISIINLHKPTKSIIKECETFRKRLAFDELLANFLVFNKLKKENNKEKNTYIVNDFANSENIIKGLSFKLTKDQINAYKEIKEDIASNQKMYRLLQGDVGSGKTIISLLIIADFVKAGYQCVVMVPTEILAKQHLKYFKEFLDPLQINIEILTSKTKQKQKIYDDISKSNIDVLIGTHSVYNKSISFRKLGLVVIDEQHKFGVKQRVNIIEKSLRCHTLIMSATPIPRSLSFALYGEIEVSLIKSKPEGRKKVLTSILSSEKITSLIDGIKRKLDKNEQVFWVLPTIGEENNFDEKESAITRFNFLKKKFGMNVSIIHGRMNKEEIQISMDEFQKKKTMILVSTTLIEVGINIPSATLIIIEEANRFGLSQLHQLRGRVVRGTLPSHCVLIYNKSLSENSKKRLQVLKQCDDGFEIAEKDLILRGSGDFFGTNQSGLPRWKFFSPYEDLNIIDNVKKNSAMILASNNEQISDFLINIFYQRKNFSNYYSP